MGVKLLPCPFCGGEAKFVKTSDEIVPGDVLVAWNVKCSRCFASLLPNNYEGSKEAAAKRWNRRAERTCRNVSTRYESFKCSKCGCAIYDTSQIGSDRVYYCSDCGAKVVDDD